ncbi:MAG: Site-specific recombinase, invertase Pin s [Clostridiaceae bacterium]|nr:Site-specific recombinase, invertase Pin s [Clostridiaceae bacterium]
MEKLRRVVFYGRVSTEHDAQLIALQNQMQWYDDQLKYHKDWILINKYIEVGITGTQANGRPQFMQMIEDAKKGKFDLIVTREVCRFARNTVDALSYTRLLKDIDVEVYFVSDNIWTMDNSGELKLGLMASLAQDESRKISERVKAGQQTSRANGVLYGNGNILGYDRTGKTYVINQEQAETVRIIFKLYLEGLGAKKIINELNKLHRKDSRGNVKWSASKINRILRNSTYKGIIAYGKTVKKDFLNKNRKQNHDADSYVYVKGDFEPIINQEDWDKVQEIRKTKTLKVNIDGENIIKGKKISQNVWLRKLRCNCGSTFRKGIWNSNKSGIKSFGYQCYNKVNNGSLSSRIKNNLDTESYCDMKMIGEWKLDLMAKTIVEEIWKNPQDTVQKAYNLIAEHFTLNEDKSLANRKKIKEQISRLETKLYNIINMRAENELSQEEFSNMKKKINSELNNLKNELINSEERQDNQEEVSKQLSVIKDALDKFAYLTVPKISDDIIENLFVKVIPFEDNKFKFVLNLNGVSKKLICSVDGRINNPTLSTGRFEQQIILRFQRFSTV